MSYPTTVDAGLVQPWILTSEETVSQGSTFTLVANTVYLYLIEVTASVSIATMRYRMGVTATGTVDLGMYDGNGNLVAHTGATNTIASGLQSINLTSFSIAPGRYSLALCPSNSTDVYVGAGGYKAGQGRFYTATNTGTAGVLPATTGNLANSAGSVPSVLAVVTGGGI